MANNAHKIIHVLEKDNARNMTLLVYAMGVSRNDTDIRIIEIAINVSSLADTLIYRYRSLSSDFTFDLSLWDKKVAYNNLLQKNIRISNYKYIKEFDIKLLIPSLVVLLMVLLLLNFFYKYLIKRFVKEKRKIDDILDTQSNLIVIFTKDKIIRCNKAYLDALGFGNMRDVELSNSKISDFFILQDKFIRLAVKDMFWADYIVEHKENSFYELFLQDKNKNQIGIFDIQVNIYIENGDKEKYYIASFRNADARYKNKQKLLLETEKNQIIIDYSNDGFIDLDTNIGKSIISRKLKRMLDYKTDDNLDIIDSFINLVHPDYKLNMAQDIQECLYSDIKSVQYNVQLFHRKKVWHWFFMRMVTIKISDSEDKRLIIFFKDINKNTIQTKRMKKKILREVEKNDKQKILLAHQNKLASMGEMIGSIAHQWRQPLNELSINVQNLKFQYKKGAINEGFIKNFVAKNKETIMFMSKTIDDFRNFFKINKDKNYFSISQAIQFCFNMQSVELDNDNIKLNIIGADFQHNGIESEFKQVILNLINNTKDAFKSNEIINREINIELKDKKIIFNDNAGGISKNDILRIFEPYFTTKEQKDSTGIGLYMSKTIIENNNGTLSVKNIDNGVSFIIDFSGGGGGG